MSATLVCCVGTMEPWNVAGLGLDSRALAGCGARAVSVVCGVSAQDGRGGHAASAIASDLIAAQFNALERAPIAAIRIGALCDEASVRSVARALRGRESAGKAVPVVYDPVLVTSAGGIFASAATIAAIVGELLPQATLVTPNLYEAARLATPGSDAGGPGSEAATVDAMAASGHALLALGARNALVTGGHLAGDPVDVLIAAGHETRFTAARLPGDLRGTGCLLACGLAAELGRGTPLLEAVELAREFVRARFATAIDIGGMRGAY